MERIVRGRSATLTKTFYSDGVATDPTGTPTVTVTRVSDGTVVTGLGAVTDETAAGTWSVTNPATSNLLLDTLTVDWSGVVNTVAQEYIDNVEVVGDVFFTVPEFRALGTAYANTTNYPTSTITDMRTTVEQALEDACNRAFVPRYERETLSGTGSTTARLKWPDIRSIRSITIDDVAGTAADVAFQPSGIAYYASGWTLGHGNIVVGYEHGMPYPPERVKRAALLLAKRWLTPSAVDDRAINMTNDSGTYAIMQAGVRGHLFDLPEVVATVDQYSLQVGVA
jgi:hypothetical protein